MLAYRTEKQKDGSHATKMTESRLIPNWQPIGLIPSEGGTPPPPPHFFALPTFSPFAIPLTLWYATRLKRNSRLLSPAFIAYSTPAVRFFYLYAHSVPKLRLFPYYNYRENTFWLDSNASNRHDSDSIPLTIYPDLSPISFKFHLTLLSRMLPVSQPSNSTPVDGVPYQLYLVNVGVLRGFHTCAWSHSSV